MSVSGSASVHDYGFYYAAGSGAQIVTVPVGNPDTITIQFSEPVTVSENDLTFVGMYTGQRPEVDTFSYDSGTNSASWRFTYIMANDMFLVSLSDAITDASSGNPLDGEWINPRSYDTSNAAISEFPSGDGDPGGYFNFVLTLLAGDFSLDNVVDEIDHAILGNSLEMDTGTFFTDGDASGDGEVTYEADYGLMHSSTASLQELFLLTDLDGDLDVDELDRAGLLANWGMSSPDLDDGDFNNDNEVDELDLAILDAMFGLSITAVS